MSLYLDFKPHSWYMGFAIRKDNNPETHTWGAYTADGMTGFIIQIEATSLSHLKQSIRNSHLKRHTGYGEWIAKLRLEYLRDELQAERISYEELAELQSLADYINDDDTELLEAAGVEEGTR